MQRPFFSIFASFVLAANVLGAQDSKPQSPESGTISPGAANGTILKFLQQSHDLDQQVALWDRAILLSRQAEMVAPLRPDLGRVWSNELFALSSQTLREDQRSFMQNHAMGMLIRLDPGRALELLTSVKIEEPPAWAASAPEMQLVQAVFMALSERDGVGALPLLQQEAERLGSQGHYPYAALGYAAMQTTLKDWGTDNQRAIRTLQSVFDPAFARYSQNAHTYLDDYEFGRMLDVLAGGLPFESVQPALHMLVKNLLETNTSKYQFEAKVYSVDGKTARADNAIDATILVLGLLINRDPELVTELESTRPQLQLVLEYTQVGRQRSIEGPARRPQALYSANPAAETTTEALRLSSVNSGSAIAKAKQFPDDNKRASTMLEIARSVAGAQPERAADVIAEAQVEIKSGDDESSINLISAQAFVAVAQDRKDELHDLLRRGFDLANRVILQREGSKNSSFVVGLGPLAMIGMQNDPDLTTTFIEALPPSYVKAELLLGAASALDPRTRLPFRSGPQQAEKRPDAAP
jgi:hypothetical protein